MPRMIREAHVQRYFVKQVKHLGGLARKVSWEGRRSAPDWYVSFSWRPVRFGKRPAFNAFVELKAPGERPRPDQLREHERLRKAGTRVYWLDSYLAVDQFLRTVFS